MIAVHGSTANFYHTHEMINLKMYKDYEIAFTKRYKNPLGLKWLI